MKGTVNFETYELTKNDKVQTVINIKRRNDNVRQRPNADHRNLTFTNNALITDGIQLISQTHLEWLSINYRKAKVAKLSESKRRLILVMFQKPPHFFPTLREIRDELVHA